MPPVDKGGRGRGRASGQLSAASNEGNIPKRGLTPQQSTADSHRQIHSAAQGSPVHGREHDLGQASNETPEPALALSIRTRPPTITGINEQTHLVPGNGEWCRRGQGRGRFSGTPRGRSSSLSEEAHRQSRHDTGAQMPPVNDGSRGRARAQRPGRTPDAARTANSFFRGQTSQTTSARGGNIRTATQGAQSPRPHPHVRTRTIEAIVTPMALLCNSPAPPRRENVASEARPLSGDRRIRIGIESEFVIQGRHPFDTGSDLKEFAEIWARNYNRTVHPRHPRMRPTLRQCMEPTEHKEWCLADDATISHNYQPPWGIELVSPILEVLPNSTWRRDVEAVWKFLHKHYCVEGRWTCGTHIHISLDPFYSLQDLKRIAQAVIHFETALEALVPSERRGNCYAMSNWLNSLELAQKNRSRPESIAYIETRMNRDQLIATMCGNDRDFCWNFRSLLNSDKRTIEFRKPPVSTTAKEALAWAEFAICFIQASIKCESPAKLQQVPPTLRGLLWFLSTNQKLGVNEPDRLEPLWAGKDLNAAFPPVYIDLQTRPLDAEEAFHRIQQADMERIQRLASSAGEPPYW